MAQRWETILAAGAANAPFAWTSSGANPLEILTIFASFDGSGAASSFLPTVELVSDAGLVLASCPIAASSAVAGGGTADVTFAPFLGSGAGGSSSVTIGPFWGLAAWQSGRYYGPQWQPWNGSSVSGQSGSFICYPLWVPNAVTIADISTYVFTPFGGQTWRGGLYTDTGFGYPNRLVIDTGAFSPGAGGAYDIAVGLPVIAGLYWLGMVIVGNNLAVGGFGGGTAAGAGTVPQTVAAVSNLANYVSGQGSSNYRIAGIVGALPDPFPAGAAPHTFGAGPAVYVKTA